MIAFGIVGTGWRAEFFLRIARACPDRFRVTGLVTRDPVRSAGIGETFGVPLYSSVETMIASERPLFMVSSVPWDVNPGVLKHLADLDIPVLSETPPATRVEEMVELCSLVENGATIQVAEQYWAQPHHLARIRFAQSGKLGEVSQVQVSAAHGYHGISLMRRYMGIGFDDAEITATEYSSPLVKGRDREGYPDAESITESSQLVAQFRFGDKLGVFDFAGDQYFSHIRNQRLLVRGERGEIINGSAVYLRDHTTPIPVEFKRRDTGHEGDLEGHHLKGIVVGEEWIYENPLAPGDLSDDEIAIGTCLIGMADHVEGGEPVYSLREACQDRYLDILMHEAAKTGETVRSERQGWV
jgi:predicted dehydrogenase